MAEQDELDQYSPTDPDGSGLPGVYGGLVNAVEAGFEGIGAEVPADGDTESDAWQQRTREQKELMPDLDHTKPVIVRGSETRPRPDYSPSIPVEEPTMQEIEDDIWAGRR